MEDNDGTTEKLITYYLWTIISPILIIFGTIGNLLSIAVMCRRNMRSSNASLYLIALSVADTFVLYTGLLRHFIRAVADIDVRDLSNLGCKINAWLVYVSVDISVWILVAFTFERILSVFVPHKVKNYCTRATSVVVIISIVIILLGFNSHILYGMEEVTVTDENETAKVCYFVTEEYSYFFQHTWPWIHFCVYSLVPFVILIIGNSCIALKVLQSRRKTRRVVPADAGLPTECHEMNIATGNVRQKEPPITISRSNKISSMTIILLILNLVFLITTTPVSLYFIVQPEWTARANTPKGTYIILLTYAVVNLIMYINNAINFVMYCVSGSRFRTELQGMFLKHKVWVLGATSKFGNDDDGLKRSTLIARRPLPTETSVVHTATAVIPRHNTLPDT